ncbi:MAG: UDP-N-acetylglucosamine pyrophosphorylase [Lachnoclostridium sp.]|nr:UDP-N-acetylglucosamine pyrophosphorylase [Lachnoclostridium sp.]
MNDAKIECLYDLNHTIAKDLLEACTYPWEALAHIETTILKIGSELPKEEYEQRENHVWIHKTARVFPSAYLGKNVIVGKNAEVRHCAFIRENAIIGEGAVVGNSTELKNVILFDSVEVPHYNYVGDSILGYKAHMGAGSITSNVRADKGLVKIHTEDGDLDTNRKKVGAMLGDFAEIGCGSVLNPGTVIGKNSNVYPLSSVRCCVTANSIYKNQGEIAEKMH